MAKIIETKIYNFSTRIRIDFGWYAVCKSMLHLFLKRKHYVRRWLPYLPNFKGKKQALAADV